MIVLAGDIGGTSTRLGLFDIENRNVRKLAFEKYTSKKFNSLGQVVRTFLKTLDVHPRAAAFGVAGPVFDGVVKTTNLPWTIDAAILSKRIGVKRTAILNDLEAHAHGIDKLVRSKDLATVQKGQYEHLSDKVLIGPGTGLGEAIIAQHGGDTVVVPSEGGHKDFAPQDKLQAKLLEYLRAKHDRVSHGHVSYERILSGPGIVSIYEFLKKSKLAKESKAVRKALSAKNADKPALIMRFARKDKLCKKTADMFFSVLGTEAGNLAIQLMSLGGVYIVGGIVRSNLSVLKSSPFLKSFRKKGRMSGIMKKIPVYVVKNEKLGILGSAALANDLF